MKMNSFGILRFCFAAVLLSFAMRAAPADLIPPATDLKTDRPRLLLRPANTPYAISLPQLKALPRDPEFARMLQQIKNLRPPRAAALALVWHLTGRTEAADHALAVMASCQVSPDAKSFNDPFHVYFTLTDMALAYDWLHNYPGFDAPAQESLRRKLLPFVENAARLGNDHVFHNYIWMFDGGAMLWALATAGDDPASTRLLTSLTDRFNRQLFRAMEYLDGANGDSAGYWWLYCENSAVMVLLAAQSAFETDVLGNIRREHGDWLNRQLDFLVQGVMPDMRFAPWGDIVAGPNGGVMREMAAKIDSQAWALRSPTGAFLSRWLAAKRGLQRFEGETAIYYFLHTRHLDTAPTTPPLAMLAGNKQGGNVLMRSGWDDGATVVGFRCTDFFGRHHHLDQGSFFIHRNGLLALDAGTYQRVGGNQMKTDAHNTLLLGGEGQRPQKYQGASTIEAFTERLPKGLETGDILFYRDSAAWTAVAGQFAQAYQPEVIQSCVRQLLFVRPGTVIVVDQLVAPEGKTLPEVRWLLHVPGQPEVAGQTVTASHARSYLRCRSLAPGEPPEFAASYRTPAGPSSSGGNPSMLDASRVIYAYEGKARLHLIHVLEVGDGQPAAPMEIKTSSMDGGRAITLEVAGKAFEFSTVSPFEIRSKE